jgi:hypothetical protein
MWARFGEVICIGAPRRRAAGLAAVGIDRLVVPEMEAGAAPGTISEKSARFRLRARKSTGAAVALAPAKLPQYL